MKHPILQVDNLTIALKESHEILVNDLCFSLKQADNLTLLGQSGSGKTLSCRAILSLLNRKTFQVDGNIRFDDTELLGIKEKSRRKYYGSQIAFIPQNPMTALDPSRKIGHQMAEFLCLHQSIDKKNAVLLYMSALMETGLMETKRVLTSLPGQLSGGMLQRVLIALAIAQEASLVIADEPTTALDAIHRDQAIEQFRHLQQRGCAILLVTHDFDVAYYMGGNVLIMKEGQMIERGSIDTVLCTPKTDYTKELIAAVHLGWR